MAEETKVTHIVQEGDTLSDLTKYYTGGNDYNAIAKDNGISDPNTIHVGQEIEFSVSNDSQYVEENSNNFEQSNASASGDVQSSTSTSGDAPTSENLETTSTEQTIENSNENQSSETKDIINQQNEPLGEPGPQTIQSSPSTTTGQQNPVSTNTRSTPSTNTQSTPQIFSNKWLCNVCPAANDFEVDKTHLDYYIGYLNSKNLVTSINEVWNNIKSHIDELKTDIETLKQAIDSSDYRNRTNDVITAIDNSIQNLNRNFEALFNAVVNRLVEAAATDEWFSETAIEYATFISETILGKSIPNPVTNASEPLPSDGSAESNQTEEAIPTETPQDPPPSAPSISASVTQRVSNADAISQLGITEEQLDIVKATIRHEAGNNPDEMLVVASVIRNRMNSGVWGGTDAYSVTTASGQFESYLGGYYKQYTNGNYYQGGTPEEVAAVSEQINAILTGNAAPVTDAERFRSGYKEGRIQYNPGGNYYF